MNYTQSFYMVFVEGGNTPTYRHSTFDGAEAEAKRLAEKFGRPAFVLQSILKVELTKFSMTAMAAHDNLPF